MDDEASTGLTRRGMFLLVVGAVAATVAACVRVERAERDNNSLHRGGGGGGGGGGD